MTIPYVTGTVSVTAGSAVVTGSGTAWATAAIAGGLFGVDSSNGNPVPILSVDSNTQLTLAKPWRGTTAAAQPYWIIRDTAYLQQLSANAQALATYIQRLDNASLAALASLVPAADKLAYFSGANTAVLTDIKAKGRDVLAADSMLSLLAKLGPVNGGNPSPTPAGAGVGLMDGDFNSVTLPGAYTIGGSWANGPAGAASTGHTGMLIVYARFTQVFQELWLATATSPIRWTRWTSTNNGSWPNPWFKMPGDMVGTVSQSGGVPFGAIMERGANANGEYVRFADGSQICTKSLSGTITATAFGTVFRDSTAIGAGNWAANFSAIPSVSAHMNNANAWGAPFSASATGHGGMVIYTASAVSGFALTVYMSAIGRWF